MTADISWVMFWIASLQHELWLQQWWPPLHAVQAAEAGGAGETAKMSCGLVLTGKAFPDEASST